MPIKATANGKTFTFPDGTSQADMASAIDQYFSSQQDQPERPAPPAQGDSPMAMADVKSVYDAPELNKLIGKGSLTAGKAGLAGLLTGDPKELESIFRSLYPDATVNAGLINLPSGVYELKSSAPARFAFDVGTFGFGGPMTGPLKQRLFKEGARSMGIEALQQTGEEALGGEFNAKDVALAGATDLAVTGAGEALSGLLRGVFGKMSQESAEMLKIGERAEVPILTSDMIPPRTFLSKSAQTLYERIPFLGTGGKREFQKAAREGALDKLAADFGVTPDIPFTDDVIDSLKSVKTERISAASALKNGARETLSTAGQVPKERFVSAIDEAIAAEKRFGTKADSELITSLEQWKQTPDGDFKFLDELRSRLGDEISDYYTGKNSQMGSKGVGYLQSLKNALTEDMDNFAAGLKNEGMTQAARDWKRANAMFFDEYSKYKDSALKTMLDKGDIKPEIVMPILKGKAPSQVQLLYDNLSRDGRNAARGAILQDVLANAGGSPEKVISSLSKLDRNLNVFFKDQDRKVLDGYKKLLESTQRASQAGVRTATGQELYTMGAVGLGGFGAATLPPSMLAVGGGLAMGGRMFESGPVRDALLKLQNTPVNSRAYDRILRDVMNEFSAAAQAMRDEDE